MTGRRPGHYGEQRWQIIIAVFGDDMKESVDGWTRAAGREKRREQEVKDEDEDGDVEWWGQVHIRGRDVMKQTGRWVAEVGSVGSKTSSNQEGRLAGVQCCPESLPCQVFFLTVMGTSTARSLCKKEKHISQGWYTSYSLKVYRRVSCMINCCQRWGLAWRREGIVLVWIACFFFFVAF